MAMYEHYAVEDDAASIVSDATILADRYDAVMAGTDFQESRSINIYTDLHPTNIPSIYDEDVATFVRSSLMQDQEKDCGEEHDEVENNNDYSKAKATGNVVSTSTINNSILSHDPRERAQRITGVREVEKSQRKALRWRTVLGRHEAFDVSCPPPLSQQGSLLRLCSSGWQPPSRPEHTKQAIGANLSSRADGEKKPVPIPTISWAAGHVDGHDDDSSISFNIIFAILSDASVASDMDYNEEEHGSYTTGSTITEEMSMVLDHFIEFETNGDYEDSEGLRLLDSNPLFTLSFDLGVRESVDSTIGGDEDGGSMSESYSTSVSSTASETMSESPHEIVAGNGSASNGLESRDSFTTISEIECSGESSTFGTATIGSSTISQHDESDKSTNGKADEDGDKSTLSKAESFSSNSSASASRTSEVISPTQKILGALTCGAMGTREVNDVFDEGIIEDGESASLSSTSCYSDGGKPWLGNEVEEKRRASEKYSPAVNFDDFRIFAGEMERGVEVDIDSFRHSNLLDNDFAETRNYQSDSGGTFCGNYHATESCVDALCPEVVHALGMQISLYACRRTNLDGIALKKPGVVMTNSPSIGEYGACEENTTKKNDEAIAVGNDASSTFAAAVRGTLSRLSREAGETRAIGQGAPKKGKWEG